MPARDVSGVRTPECAAAGHLPYGFVSREGVTVCECGAESFPGDQVPERSSFNQNLPAVLIVPVEELPDDDGDDPQPALFAAPGPSPRVLKPSSPPVRRPRAVDTVTTTGDVP